MTSKNFRLSSVGDVLQLGKEGPVLDGTGVDGYGGYVKVTDASSVLTRVQAAGGVATDDLVAKYQLDPVAVSAAKANADIHNLRLFLPAPQILAPRTDRVTTLTTALNSLASTTLTLTANTLRLWPFIPTRTFTCTQFSARVTTAGASSIFRILVYQADATTGYPTNKYVESTDLSGGVAGGVTYVNPTDVTFEGGKVYWTGIHPSNVGTQPALRAIGVGAQMAFPIYTSITTATANSLVQLVVAVGSAPATWSFAVSQFSTNVACPQIFGNVTSVTP